ncbi:DUF3826 domain-containing protein [Fibrella forsythiae]|uniref:DUF3826 domain-containing protein n=1 Tax=Fibrella forsythiae TaxID=2817061 RepID=A0ABS3JEP6_9BACT|nr:DUF3826 domain-containing protein [Fibrella forsythiae]MBO0947911.1 DUF3826 domain-containing protein [Fibrella forsythiae]
MFRFRKTILTAWLLTGLVANLAMAQESTTERKEAAYTRTITDRAAKIVGTLGLTDPQVAARVRDKIAQQYRNLNTIHEGRKTALAGLTDSARKEAVETEAAQKIAALHSNYLAGLAQDLSSPQIDLVKNGMTYGVVPITYSGYLAMLPNLTDEQKAQLLTYLTEARERAMDEGTSEKKHAMFGKYKGRINNYLSAAGIDMKKASKEWEERIAEEAKKAKK